MNPRIVLRSLRHARPAAAVNPIQIVQAPRFYAPFAQLPSTRRNSNNIQCRCGNCMNKEFHRNFFSSFGSSKDNSANENNASANSNNETASATAAATANSTQGQQPSNGNTQSSAASETQKPTDAPDVTTKLQELEKAIATLQAAVHERDAKIKDLNDKWVRAVAETENVRKRGRTEVENTKKFAVQQFAKSMIEVADTLEMAIANSRKSVMESQDPLVKSLFEGIEMTEKVLAKALESNSVTKFNAHGQKFDPNFHFALFQVEDDSLEPNTVAQVLKHGYLLNERILRAANVGTTKPKPSGHHTHGQSSTSPSSSKTTS